MGNNKLWLIMIGMTILVVGVILNAEKAGSISLGQTVTVTISPAPEKSVAYIYADGFKVDGKVIDLIEDMGYNVTIIHENALPGNLSSFSFIYIGDDNFKKANLIPVGEIPTVITNYYNTPEWGLTDRDGVSQLSSTSQLGVLRNGDLLKVYMKAFSARRIGVPYYFLNAQNKAPDLIQRAGTQTTSSGIKFGDVISYGEPGTRLLNGKLIKEEICYFGIVASDYWTDKARQLFRECVEFVTREDSFSAGG